jgi:O-antigen ligase
VNDPSDLESESRFDSAEADPRPPLHPLEAVLVALTALHLAFLPWAIGAVHPWSQLASLGLALVGFALAMIPRTELRDFSTVTTQVSWPARRLLRFPIFWAGAVLLAYLAVQASNPAWRYFRNESAWWLEPLPHLAWLPAGVDAPFERSNVWGALIVATSLWLLVCSVWAGFLRRKSYHCLFIVLIANAALLAGLGVLQRLSGAKRIFWSYLPSNDSFLASFIYPNHAGPYFYLIAALAVGLAWRYYQRAMKRNWTTRRARALLAAGVFIGVAVIYSASRASIALLLVFAVAVGTNLALRRLTRPAGRGDHPEFFPLALGLALVLGLGFGSLQANKLASRFATFFADPSNATHDRATVGTASIEMFADRWVYGWGAGCFRHGFPLYAQKYPAIYLAGPDRRRSWENAHNDLLQLPVEVGLVGTAPVLLMLGWLTRELFRRRFWLNPVGRCVALGAALVFLHAAVDFVFRSPAVLFTWSFLLVAAVRWSEFELGAKFQEVVPSRPGRERRELK